MTAKNKIKPDGPRIREVIKRLKAQYTEAKCSLDHSSPYQLLVATVLSAQCTDERVNKVTPHLFKRYPDFGALAEADQNDLEEIIRSTGFFRNKSKNLVACAKTVHGVYADILPKSVEELSQLPGVGRKTANVVLGNAFGIAAMVVDTHVSRLSQRLGLAKGKTPEVIELELMRVIPKVDWVVFSHLLIYHGRAVCKARKPLCDSCHLESICPRKGV
ncbi:MAG: endonuclease III [Bdellovibrionales bacterium CG10_big_fil_rev_8_21_14_0_10_45_34]|nr:MAG: endonuclease III [Bdellovibrionales bacterium CG10_big_fil_rev_8_21_14_0_10_45_34]